MYILLPKEEVHIWLKHLQTVAENRKQDANKAAKTRRQQAQQERVQYIRELYTCGACGRLYEKETEEEQNWIGCDRCNAWFHCVCVNIFSEPSSFLCMKCKSL